MTIIEGIRLAIGAILANKLRSVLTLLGVIIGVASVVAMISVGSGAEKSVTAEFSSLGTNIVYVQPDYADDEHVPPRLKPRDLRALEVGATYLKDLTPFDNTVAEVRYGQHLVTTTVAGTGDRFIDVQSLGLAEGRFFSGQEARLGARLCVIGPQVQEDLAGQRSLVGKYLRIEGERFLVIGAMARKAERTMVSDGLTGDNMVYIPLNALQRITGAADVPFAMGVPVRPELTPAAVGQVKAIIARIYGPDHGLTIASIADTLKTVNKVIGIFTVVLGCLGGISLLVGGIGVMNIMLVAVTERTQGDRHPPGGGGQAPRYSVPVHRGIHHPGRLRRGARRPFRLPAVPDRRRGLADQDRRDRIRRAAGLRLRGRDRGHLRPLPRLAGGETGSDRGAEI